jgi:PIN domain nuclease of toxin-antitoxin system
MAIRTAQGKMNLNHPFAQFVPMQLAQLDVRVISISFDHFARLSSFGPLHRDAFDRMLIAHADRQHRPHIR